MQAAGSHSAIVSFWQNWKIKEALIPYCLNEGNTALAKFPTGIHINLKK